MRIIYNTSFIVDEAIETEWIGFIQKHYIRPLLSEGLCEDIIFTKVSIDQPEGKTYSLQLIFSDEQRQQDFIQTHLPALEERLIKHYNGKYVCFSSILSEICLLD